MIWLLVMKRLDVQLVLQMTSVTDRRMDRQTDSQRDSITVIFLQCACNALGGRFVLVAVGSHRQLRLLRSAMTIWNVRKLTPFITQRTARHRELGLTFVPHYLSTRRKQRVLPSPLSNAKLWLVFNARKARVQDIKYLVCRCLYKEQFHIISRPKLYRLGYSI